MSSAIVTNDNRKVKNAMYRMVIPQVLDENRWLFFILSQH